MILAVVIVGLTALAYLVEGAASDDYDVARAMGGALGSVILPGVFFLGFRAWKSTRAGAIAAAIVGGLGLLAVLGQAAQTSETEQEIVAAMEELDLDTSPVDLTDEQIDCLNATGLDADDILTALTDTGQTGAATQLELLDAYATCAPEALLTDRSIEQFRDGFNIGLPGEITSEEAECVLREALASPDPGAVLAGSEPNELLAALNLCLSAESMALIDGTGGDAQEFGDDPVLDLIAERCRTEDRACDLLYISAPIGSQYWDLADECGGRGLSGTVSCEAGMLDDDANGYYDDASPAWTAVLADCRSGDMISCDLARFTSELQSDAERVGATCGDRLAILNDTCVDRYGLTADE